MQLLSHQALPARPWSARVVCNAACGVSWGATLTGLSLPNPILAAGHAFHQHCFAMWQQKQCICPLGALRLTRPCVCCCAACSLLFDLRHESELQTGGSGKFQQAQPRRRLRIVIVRNWECMPRGWCVALLQHIKASSRTAVLTKASMQPGGTQCPRLRI